MLMGLMVGVACWAWGVYRVCVICLLLLSFVVIILKWCLASLLVYMLSMLRVSLLYYVGCTILFACACCYCWCLWLWYLFV